MPTAERIMDVLGRLREGDALTVERLAAELALSARTIRRDR